MTKTTYTNNTLRIPTREEFHKYASNLITEEDFCTNHPSRHASAQVNKVASAIRITYNYDRTRKNNLKKKGNESYGKTNMEKNK